MTGPVFFRSFFEEAFETLQLSPVGDSRQFLDAKQAYEWPGNVRQLENLTERLLLTHSNQGRLTAEHFDVLVAPVADSEPLDAVSEGDETDTGDVSPSEPLSGDART